MDIAQPALIANVPGLQTPLIARSGGHTFSNADISDNARVHFGDVFNVSNDRPQPAKEQPFTVPFCRDGNFIPRDAVVVDLLKMVKSGGHNRAALYGLGGVGKTQIAIEFAYAYRDAHPDAAVFWLFAGTPERLLESFVRVAVDLGLPGHNDKDCEIYGLVLRYLEDFRNGRWLLVVDNVDDNVALGATAEGASSPLIQSLPPTRGCMILITTRDRRIAQTVAGSPTRAVAIDPMSMDDAALLFETRLSDPSLRASCVQQLLGELGRLPLAIVQAAAYMTQYQLHTSDYLELLRRAPGDLLDNSQNTAEHMDTRRDKTQTIAVLPAIRLTMARVTEQHPDAAILLMFMAMCNAQNIPKKLLAAAVPKLWSEQKLRASLHILCSLSLVMSNSSDSAYSMHRLVQSTARAMIAHFDYSMIPEIAADIVLKAWPSHKTKDDWLWRDELQVHAHNMLNGPEVRSLGPATSMQLHAQVGIHLQTTRRKVEAHRYLCTAFELCVRLPDEQQMDWLNSITDSLSNVLLFFNKDSSIGKALLRAMFTLAEQRRESDEIAFLTAAIRMARGHFTGSLAENYEAEKLLNRLAEYRVGDKVDSDACKVAWAELYGVLGLTYSVRHELWQAWEVEGSSTRISRSEVLSSAKKWAIRASAEFCQIKSQSLHINDQWCVALLSLGIVFGQHGQYREADHTFRHSLCLSLRHPAALTDEHRAARILAILNENGMGTLEESEQSMDAFAAQHQECTLGAYGCRFYAAELD